MEIYFVIYLTIYLTTSIKNEVIYLGFMDTKMSYSALLSYLILEIYIVLSMKVKENVKSLFYISIIGILQRII